MEHITPRGFHFYQGSDKFLVRGISYGPFRPNGGGLPYPEEGRVREDFRAIAETGANVVRLYTPPDKSLALAAEDHGLRLLIDIPWPTHLDVYSDAALREKALNIVDEGIERVRSWPNVLGVFLGNEIPPDLVRWVGERKVRAFLRQLYRRAKSKAPELLIGYANYPSVEYLRADIFDFVGFNVYLENPSDFRDYVIRLRHLYPEKPVLVSECGLDVLRSSEECQARVLESYAQISYEVGMAGVVVFSWTDEWHAGGYDIEGWSFGLVDAERRPKPAREAVRRAFASAPQCRPLGRWPRISVVVATYNGARTLRECLRSLQELLYPDYEIIVVDDGSTDETSAILQEFPGIGAVYQENGGLSSARNAGIRAATGEIVAFTDSDCFADRDWLYHLALVFQNPSYAGMGGPNLTPRTNGPVQRAVALAPGHAAHVLIGPSDAEHIPGCNMAFRRDVLERLGGFDPQFRKAGDDVDMIWRFQDEGYRIGFCPGAFVWHHRRPTLRAYWKQQIGYGEAEALLMAKHPHRFNDRGQSIWRGTIYPDDELEPLFAKPNVHYGIFGSAGYQCVYEKRGNVMVYFLTSLEWWIVCAALAALGAVSETALTVGAAGLTVALGIGGLRAYRKWDRERRESARILPLVWLLWVTQPLVRAATRYWKRWGWSPAIDGLPEPYAPERSDRRRGKRKRKALEYWGESGAGRLEVLRELSSKFTQWRWVHFPNSGWEPWDLSVIVSWWFKVILVTAEENHGGPKRLLRLRFRLIPSGLFYLFSGITLLLCGFLALYNTLLARYLLIAFLVVGWEVYLRGRKGKFRVQALADSVARANGFAPIGEAEATDPHPPRLVPDNHSTVSAHSGGK